MVTSMAEPAHRVNYSLEAYLALEASSSVKHEFLEGQIYGMAGTRRPQSRRHRAVFGQLRAGSCRLYDPELRVRVQQTGLLTYPDVTVTRGPLNRILVTAMPSSIPGC